MVTSQKRKQRKMQFEAKLHERQKMVAAHVSKGLRKQLKARSAAVRKGDEVKVMRGKYSGKKGKVVDVDLKRCQVRIEGIVRKKANGTEINVPFHPSKLMITERGEK